MIQTTIPVISEKDLKERNFKERLEFIDKYVEWQKKVSNKQWSEAQKRVSS